jgi:hypothetical protein
MTKTCKTCGKNVEIPCDRKTFYALKNWRGSSRSVQEIASNLSPECWKKIFGDENEDA